MTNDEVIAALRDDCVFGLDSRSDGWRAFYRCPLHFDFAELPGGAEYRSVVAPTVVEVIEAAYRLWVAEQMKAKLTK